MIMTEKEEFKKNLPPVPIRIEEKIREKQKHKKSSDFFGVSSNELIGYAVALMFFILAYAAWTGLLSPNWATAQYRTIVTFVLVLYGIYRAITTRAKAQQRKRTRRNIEHRDRLGLEKAANDE
jgi:hypothetical protein